MLKAILILKQTVCCLKRPHRIICFTISFICWPYYTDDLDITYILENSLGGKTQWGFSTSNTHFWTVAKRLLCARLSDRKWSPVMTKHLLFQHSHDSRHSLRACCRSNLFKHYSSQRTLIGFSQKSNQKLICNTIQRIQNIQPWLSFCVNTMLGSPLTVFIEVLQEVSTVIWRHTLLNFHLSS